MGSVDATIVNGKDFDVIIVGAGVVGSALAYGLGNDGRNVLIVERDLKEPDRIVGELLQPGGFEQLRALGLESAVEGIDAILVDGYAVTRDDGDHQNLQYGFYPDGKAIMGRSFHHGRFVQKLRGAAAACNRVSMLQATVTDLVRTDDGVVHGVICRDHVGSKAYRAPLTIICDGCFSNFRRRVGHTAPRFKSHFVGMVLRDVELEHQRKGNVFVTPAGPILCYQIGTNEIRLLADVPEPLPSDLADHLVKNIAQYLPAPLRGALVRAAATDKVRSMPNSQLFPCEYSTLRGALLLGDAANMRHPLTGGGMTVGLSDVVLLRRLLAPLALHDAEDVRQALLEFQHLRVAHASTINVLAGALYEVFKDEPLREALWDYFKLGGVFQQTPMQLLGGYELTCCVSVAIVLSCTLRKLLFVHEFLFFISIAVLQVLGLACVRKLLVVAVYRTADHFRAASAALQQLW
eukprot:TRINITY_DN1431_c1_g1_i2.p1 TRINITY_DN1431_c1_g1~~TRINITY_DN1431_c1_g1_i2.p1  ORF type:complete len:463 (-),score=59.85 TRINITY_DN1431_c1_g1_i2:505-1893(-)